jgi:hypothetical protein
MWRGGRYRKVDNLGEKATTIFDEIVKKAYEKGMTEENLTLDQLITDLKADLKNIVTRY